MTGMSNVHVVIPSYNNWELTHELLWNLNRKEKENISSVFILDDASPDSDVLGGLKWWKGSGLLPLDYANATENMGFPKAANKGLKYICQDKPLEDVVILLSTDVLIQGKFISQIKEILWNTPMSLVGGVVYTQNTGWNTFGDKIFPYAEGWLLATKVENWRELGFFDDRYAPSDFEDVDLSTTAVSMGYQLVPLNNVGLVHLGGRSIGYSPEREKLTKINQEKFRLKWIK